MANHNVAMQFGQERHTGIVADCFDYLKGKKREYDVVVLDPPAFARSPKALDKAARGYKEINRNGIAATVSGGLLFTFSCSGVVSRDLFRKIVFGAAAETGRDVQILHQLSQPFDHPVNIYHPEGEYPKGLVLRVL